MLQIIDLNFSKVKLSHISHDLRIVERSIGMFHIQSPIFLKTQIVK